MAKCDWTMDEAKTWIQEHGKSLTGDKAEKSWLIPILKSEDKHYVFAIVLEPEKEDGQGDIESEEEIEKACDNFMLGSQNVGVQHEYINPSLRIVRNWITLEDSIINKQVVKKGSWVQKIFILDEKIVKQIQDEELTGVSIKGHASSRRE